MRVYCKLIHEGGYLGMLDFDSVPPVGAVIKYLGASLTITEVEYRSKGLFSKVMIPHLIVRTS